MTSPALTLVMRQLIVDIEREHVSIRVPPDAAHCVAILLEHYVSCTDLLAPEHCVADPAAIAVYELYRDSAGDFLIVALVFPPGTETPIHDHSAWCDSGIYRGTVQETRFAIAHLDTADGKQEVLIPISTMTRGPGGVDALVPPGDIHKVTNAGKEIAISIHIYGADIRDLPLPGGRIYDLPIVPELPQALT